MSLAHELGHLILNEAAGGHSFDGHSDPGVERLCNQLAGELLCPGDSVQQYFKEKTQLANWHRPIRCQTLMEAARDFGVSVDVITKRVFFDLEMVQSSVALIWRFIDNTKKKDSGAALRVSSAWHSLTEKTFFPLNKTAPTDSIVMRAFERDGSFCRVEHITLGTLNGDFEVEASGFMSFPFRSMSPPGRAVLSLLT